MTVSIDKLVSELSSDIVSTEPELISLYSQDVFGEGAPAKAVVKPTCIEELQHLVRLCRSSNTPLIARGGGMSYTSGYLAEEEGGLLLDMTGMNKIVALDIENAFVTVEAGMTWSALFEALTPHGLRTPFWGSLSGRFATIGGGMSQNAVFWGSGYHGAAGDSVLSLGVVTGTGDFIETGSAAQKNAKPFSRHFGPDLTGLFVGDCGAMGIKATVTLPLITAHKAKAFAAYAFPDGHSMMSAMAEISRESLASECFGFDPYLQAQRMKRASLAADVTQLSGVIKAGETLKDKIVGGAKVALAGRRFMDDVAWSFSTVSEGRTDAEAAFQKERIDEISREHQGRELPDSIPRILAANPFGPVNNMVGAEGERWLPVHALVPHSDAKSTLDAIEALFDRRKATMTEYSIETGYLITTVSQQITLIEPVFFWPDALNELHEHSLEDDHLARLNRHEAVPGAWDAVNTIKSEMTAMFSELGTSHFQLGRAYHYRDGLADANAEIVTALKSKLDPDGIINPGVLGL